MSKLGRPALEAVPELAGALERYEGVRALPAFAGLSKGAREAGQADIIRAVRDTSMRNAAPSVDEVGDILGNWVKNESGILTRTKANLNTSGYQVDPDLARVGVRPVRHIDPTKPDQSLVQLLRDGRQREFFEALTDMTHNVMAQAPEELVTAARARGGSLYYPAKATQLDVLAEANGLPRQVLTMPSSVASANASPDVELTRLVSIMPFARVGKAGAEIDWKQAEKVLGKQAVVGLRDVGNALVDSVNNPDFANTMSKGLAAKTFPYGILDVDPKNPLALVEDTVGTNARVGAKSSLPDGAVQSMYGQIAERLAARLMGVPYSAMQEIPWFTNRAVMNASNRSAFPFTADELARMARGELLMPPHAGGQGSPADVKALTEGLSRVVQGRGQLVSPELAALARRNVDEFVSKIGPDNPNYIVENGRVIPRRDVVENIVLPRERGSARDPRLNVNRMEMLLNELDALSPSEKVAEIQALLKLVRGNG